MIKTILRKILSYAVQNDFIWAALSRLPFTLAQFAVWRRIQYEEDVLKKNDRYLLLEVIDDV